MKGWKLWVAVAAIVAASSASRGSEVLEIEKRGIDVSGTATLKAVPDIVRFRVTIRNLEAKAIDASNRNSDVAKELIELLKDSGIDEKKIQTSWMDLKTIYRERHEVSSGVKGYLAESSLGVELDDIDRFDKVRTALLEKGASDVDRILFTSSQMEELRRKARGLAVEAARKKAADIASKLGIKVGNVLYVGEEAKSFRGVWRERGLAPNVMASQAGEGEADIVQGPPSIARGQIEIKERVQVIFDIEYPE